MKWFIRLSCVVFVIAGLAYWSTVRITKNFDVVDPGKLYRSAQLTPSEMQDAINQYGIKTVISLRGAPKNSYWYPGEIEVLKKNNVAFYDFGLEIDYFETKEELRAIAKLFKEAEKPILIHCRTGADRTGEISALYVLEEMKLSKEEALKQLTIKNWHVPFFHPAKTEFIKAYQGHDWLMNEYDECHYPEFIKHPESCS